MKTIPSFTKYIISEDGKTILGIGRIKKTLSQLINKDGYYQLSLYNETERKCVRTHRLVAETYVPNPNNYQVVNHIDGNKLNNHYSNLEWCTTEHNIQHAYRTGLMDNAKLLSSKRGKLKSKDVFQYMGKQNRKLSDLDVINIRHLADTKQKTYKELALLYNYDRSSIGKIVRRERYSEIE